MEDEPTPEFLAEQRERMCTSKRAYTKKEAQEAVNFRSGRKGHKRRANRTIRMYQCPLANHWHLTNKEYAYPTHGRRAK